MRKTLRNSEAKSSAGAATKALTLLNLFVARRHIRVTDASIELSISGSTAHRLLTALKSAGYVRQERHHATYTVGPALAELSRAISLKLDLDDAAWPHLLRLADDLNETAHVAILRGSDVLFLGCARPNRPSAAVSREGCMMPAYATAAGKALLADLSRLDIERLYPTDELTRMTSKTLPSRTRLLDNLRQVRELGYATHVEESQRRIVAYACPVRDAAGTTRAAVVVAGPIVRFASYSAPSIIAKLQAAADATFADFTDSH